MKARTFLTLTLLMFAALAAADDAGVEVAGSAVATDYMSIAQRPDPMARSAKTCGCPAAAGRWRRTRHQEWFRVSETLFSNGDMRPAEVDVFTVEGPGG